MIRDAGSTDVTTYFVLRTAADGTETVGATITDIDLQYVRSGVAPSAKVDAIALAATNSAHADNKAIEIDGTDAPGLYRVDWPDAAFAAGVPEVILTVKLAGSFTEHLRVELDSNNLPERLDRNADLVESQRGSHTWQGDYYYVDPVNGDTHGNGNRGGRADPYKTIQDCHDNAITDNNHDVIFLVSGAVSGATTHTIAGTTTISKNYVFLRGPGRNFIITRTGSGDTLAITGDGVEVSGARIGTAGSGSGDGIDITDADFARIHNCWFLDTQGDGVRILRGSNCRIHDNNFEGTGVGGSGQGIHIVGTGGSSNDNSIFNNQMNSTAGDAILIEQGTTNDTLIYGNDIHDAGGWGINIGVSSTRAVVYNNVLGNNSSGDVNDGGSNSLIEYRLDVNADGEAGLDFNNTSGTLDAAQFGADFLTAAKIADDAFVTANFATGCLTAGAFAADALVAATFAASSLNGKGDWNRVTPDTAGTAPTAQEIWEYGTRVLTANTNLNDLNAAGIRSAVGLASANLDTQLADIPTVAEFNARTLVAASYFDPANDTVASVTTVGTVTNAVVTDAASRTASKATGYAVAGDAMTLTGGERTTLADVILVRAVQNVENSADKHSLGALIMFVTNWSISDATLTAKKPSNDSDFATYTLTTTADVDPVTGVK